MDSSLRPSTDQWCIDWPVGNGCTQCAHVHHFNLGPSFVLISQNRKNALENMSSGSFVYIFSVRGISHACIIALYYWKSDSVSFQSTQDVPCAFQLNTKRVNFIHIFSIRSWVNNLMLLITHESFVQSTATHKTEDDIEDWVGLIDHNIINLWATLQ